MLAGLAVAAVAALFPAGAAAAPAGCGVLNGLGTFSTNNQPGDCWRPYEDASPFNRPVPSGAPAAPDSAGRISALLAAGHVSQLVFGGDPQRDGGVPIYWSAPSDPVYTLHCTKHWGSCPLEGLQIHMPAGAQPTGGVATAQFDHDAHLTVIDQQSGWEYDMWNVWSITASTINFSWGGKTRIDGNGLGSAAVAAGFGSVAGPIRPEELIGGQIDHALSMVVPCTDSQVYPADGTGISCDDAGLPSSLSIPMGSHLQLRMSRAAINRLDAPTWKKTILRALATYGAYVSDTSGVADQWGFETESGWAFTSLGKADPWVQWARSLGVQPADFNHNGYSEYWFDLAAGVPWQRLRIVSQCAADGSCPAASKDNAPKLRAARRCRRGLMRWRRRADSGAGIARKRARWSRHCARLASRARQA